MSIGDKLSKPIPELQKNSYAKGFLILGVALLVLIIEAVRATPRAFVLITAVIAVVITVMAATVAPPAAMMAASPAATTPTMWVSACRDSE